MEAGYIKVLITVALLSAMWLDVLKLGTLSLRVHVPNNWVLRIWVIVIIVLVLGKYMIIWYLDP